MDDKAVRDTLLEIYNKLLTCYGPQDWWPAEEPFEVITGAILTQSTAWTNVEKAIDNLKAAGSLSPQAIRELPRDELAAIIRPSGYYNAKARKLQAFTEWLYREYGDSLKKMFATEAGRLRKQLLDVHGIGEETAASIILYAAEKPVFVIDAYTRRIIDRAGLAPTKNTYTAYQNLFTDNLPPDTEMFNEYHALLVRLGKEVCRKKSLCERCCLNTTTAAYTGDVYPCSAIQQR